ncbi:MAG TPA: hypothetical protein VEJ87_02480 [Acidimicrobiales bacterium]|nr:hypothetical protein [Acidimicrobiales bacterium]
MSDEKSAKDRLLDLVIYAPAGLALTVADEVPKLANRGRDEIEKRIVTSRTIGEFAVRFGRSEFEKRVGQLFSSTGEAETARPASSAGTPRDEQSGSPFHQTTGGSHQTTGGAVGGGIGAGGETKAEHALRQPGRTNQTSRASAHLAIPGYDSLSASQVVQRLGGLSSLELREVRAHEAACRARRTVLNRADQLLSEEGRPTSTDGPSLEGDQRQ